MLTKLIAFFRGRTKTENELWQLLEEAEAQREQVYQLLLLSQKNVEALNRALTNNHVQDQASYQRAVTYIAALVMAAGGSAFLSNEILDLVSGNDVRISINKNKDGSLVLTLEELPEEEQAVQETSQG